MSELKELGPDAAKTIVTDIFTTYFPNCVNCDNFDESTEVCSLVNQRPPAKIIARGCERWIVRIPF